MKRFPFFPYLFFLFASVIVFPYVRWYADNPDTFQYISIAKKYLSGDWQQAINGYWSPLISWLLTIPILIFKNEILAFKILQFLTGLFVLHQWIRLIHRTPIAGFSKSILILIAIPFLVDYAFLNLTPDLLFVGLLLMLINTVSNENIFSDRRQSIRAGIAGGLLYTAKAFGFPFFIAFIFLVFIIENFRKALPGEKWKNLTFLYGVFFMVCSFWIAAISFHYGRFTISEASRFNRNAEAAPLPGRSEELPILSGGIFIPVNDDMSAWESPGEYLKNDQVTLFSSPQKFFQIVSRNISSIYYFDFRHQAGALFFIFLLIFLFRKGFKRLVSEKWLLVLLVFIILFYVGYSLILVHARYTWINNLLMIVSAMYLIQVVFESSFYRYVRFFFISVLILLSVKRPLKEILFTADGNYPVFWMFQAIKHPFETMWIFYRPDIRMQKAVDEIQKQNKFLKANFASLKTPGMERDGYTSCLRLVNSVNGKYYGQVNDDIKFTDLKNILLSGNIDYLVTWRNTDFGIEIPEYVNFDAGIRIYRLRTGSD